MAQAIQAKFDAHYDVGHSAQASVARVAAPNAAADIRLAVYEELSVVEKDWRAFEQRADCTVFQTYDWLATWQRYVGAPACIQPAIVVGRDGAGEILFILPFAISATASMRALTWLGSDLCDYNAPLLAPGFSAGIGAAGFAPIWARVTELLQGRPALQFDFACLLKMPAMVGAQPNPMVSLSVTENPSGAYLTHLEGDWETFYTTKRSSTTRRRDRTKRKRLSEIGEVQLVTPANEDGIRDTLDILMAQKARSFARMGVGNLFARPGYAAFFRAFAADACNRNVVHVSCLEVGETAAAVNLGLVHRDRYYHLLASYDDGEVSRYGPGMAHLHDLLREAIGRGLRIFDFTIGDERYKRDWCDTVLTLYDHVAAAGWRGKLVTTPMLVQRRVKRWIKQTPVVWDTFSRIRAAGGSLARMVRG